MNLTVNEIFYSLQGEGGRVGEASIFIRLTKCNLACSFCDTDFAKGESMNLEQILAEIQKFPCKWIIWTGGEPTLQLNDQVVAYFHNKGYSQAIETNGTRPLPQGLDYITCSPKKDYDSICNRMACVDEIRIPVAVGDLLPAIGILPKARNYFLSPVFDGDAVNRENINYCIGLILNDPRWKLSLQIHKLIGIQ